MSGRNQSSGETASSRRMDRVVSLRWSKEPPTVPGWYWSKNHHGRVSIERVIERPGHRYLAIMENTWCGWDYYPVEKLGREWAGPIPEPEAS